MFEEERRHENQKNEAEKSVGRDEERRMEGTGEKGCKVMF